MKPAIRSLRLIDDARPKKAITDFAMPSWKRLDVLVERMLSRPYCKPFVVDDFEYRALCFSTDGCTQSEMYVDDPTKLATDYCRKMMGFLLFHPSPGEVLMIGLGGGSLAKYCHRHLPASHVTVVEIDAEVIALRGRFFIPPDDERLRVVNQDGATYIEQMVRDEKRVDVILVDAFDQNGLAKAVLEESFVKNAKRALTAQGIFVMNLVADESDSQRHIAMIQSVFGGLTIVIAIRWGSNLIIFAGAALQAAPGCLLAQSNAAWAQERLGLAFPTLLRRINEYQRSHL